MTNTIDNFRIIANKIYDPSGKEFILKGLNMFSWEGINNVDSYVHSYLNEWGFNAIRVPNYLLGSWGQPHPELNNYATNKIIVDAYTSQDAVVIFDAHDLIGGYYEGDDWEVLKDYWRDMAQEFKGNPNVWFNLHNEPGNATPNPQWVAYHRELIDIIRNEGANNTIIVDGEAWGQDKHTHTLENSALEVMENNENILFSLHVYEQWNHEDDDLGAYFDTLQNLGIPIIVGEYGSDHQGQNTLAASTKMMEAAQAREIGRAVWVGKANDNNDLTTGPGGHAEHFDTTNPEILTGLGQLVWDDLNRPEDLDQLSGYEEPTAPELTHGVFEVDPSGQVQVDFLYDGVWQAGEVAIFSLENMGDYTPGTQEYIYQASLRAVSNSSDGHIVIKDSNEGARFSGGINTGINWEYNYNWGSYLDIKTFSMNPGERFGVMLLPNGSVQEIVDNPDRIWDPGKLPFFSIPEANPGFSEAQMVAVDDNGTFAFEEIRTDWYQGDRDYNDVVFQLLGASINDLASMDDWVDPAKDWRNTDVGEALLDYSGRFATAQMSSGGGENNLVMTLEDESMTNNNFGVLGMSYDHTTPETSADVDPLEVSGWGLTAENLPLSQGETGIGDSFNNVDSYTNNANNWGFNTIHVPNYLLGSYEQTHPKLDDYSTNKMIVDAYTSQGAVVIFSAQDRVGSYYEGDDWEVLKDYWRDMAQEFKDNPNVWFNLHSKPGNATPNPQWGVYHRELIDIIRNEGANNTIIVDGESWAKDKDFHTLENSALEVMENKENILFFPHVDEKSNHKAEDLDFYFNRLQDLSIPIKVGEFGSDNKGQDTFNPKVLTELRQLARNALNRPKDLSQLPGSENPAAPELTHGVFEVGPSDQVQFDFLYDGVWTEGEVAIFSLETMGDYTLGTQEYIYQAALRAVSNSSDGHIVIEDDQEGARFNGGINTEINWEDNLNFGQYLGVKTFDMNPGDRFGVMFIQNSTVQDIIDNPDSIWDAGNLPFFSIPEANPGFSEAQMVAVDDNGTFALEDVRVDWYPDDLDYNDVVFQLAGASINNVASMDDWVDPAKDWRNTSIGEALLSYSDHFSASEMSIDGSGTRNSSGISNLALRLEQSDVPLLNTPINRFQNRALPGSYLYAGPEESQDIRDNFSDLIDEGTVFKAAVEPDEQLIGFYRFRSNQGTYLLVGEQERNSINRNPNFSGAYTEEGLVFYVYGVGAGEAATFNRLRSLTTPGVYLYATGDELAQIQNNLGALYFDEGPAFEAPI